MPPSECLFIGDGGSRELTGAVEVGMTAVRLAAPDLSHHLTFNAEPDWTGPAVTALADLVRLGRAGADSGGRRRPGRLSTSASPSARRGS